MAFVPSWEAGELGQVRGDDLAAKAGKAVLAGDCNDRLNEGGAEAEPAEVAPGPRKVGANEPIKKTL